MAFYGNKYFKTSMGVDILQPILHQQSKPEYNLIVRSQIYKFVQSKCLAQDFVPIVVFN
jgi:hypothetical protein